MTAAEATAQRSCRMRRTTARKPVVRPDGATGRSTTLAVTRPLLPMHATPRGERPVARDPRRALRRGACACSPGAGRRARRRCSPARRPGRRAARSTWSASWRTTARSWLMSSMPKPNSRCSPASRSSTAACTVTSSAEVGSSAMTSAGRSASARATATRCRWPPDSWCGNRSAHVGSSCTAVSSSRTRSARSAAESVPWTSSGSAMLQPMVCRGLSDDAGSWNTMPTRLRSSRSRRPRAVRRSLPSTSTEPATTGTSPASARPIVDLPEPDSPTRPTVSPACRSRSMPDTVGPPRREYRTATSRRRATGGREARLASASSLTAAVFALGDTSRAPGAVSCRWAREPGSPARASGSAAGVADAGRPSRLGTAARSSRV